MTVAQNYGGASQVHHVILSDRSPEGDAGDLLDGIVVSDAPQLFFSDLNGRLVNPSGPDAVLASIDDVDRSLRSVRLSTGHNQLVFIVSAKRSATFKAELTDERDPAASFEVHLERRERIGNLKLRPVIAHLIVPPHASTRDVKLTVTMSGRRWEWPVRVFAARHEQPSEPEQLAPAMDPIERGAYTSVRAHGSDV
jgi:hypothetical protein